MVNDGKKHIYIYIYLYIEMENHREKWKIYGNHSKNKKYNETILM